MQQVESCEFKSPNITKKKKKFSVVVKAQDMEFYKPES